MRRECLAWATGALCLGALFTPRVFAIDTGPFNGPLTSAFLSIDLNGGNAPEAKPTQGWNGSFASPAFSADQYGVTWSPWGGSNSQSSQTFGDGTLWPQSQTSQAGTSAVNGGDNKTTFTKNFGATSVTYSAPGTASQYATFLAGTIINSRDRGAANGAITYSPAALLDKDMFRDLTFAGSTGANVQGTNHVQVHVGGLTPGQLYTIAAYSYDNASNNVTTWTALAPTTELGVLGYFVPGTNTFLPPVDEQTINWRDGAAANTLRAPAVFNLIADQTGAINVWGFGGDGGLNQNSSTTYLNGIQVALVPEPGSIAVIGLVSAAVMARRRRD